MGSRGALAPGTCGGHTNCGATTYLWLMGCQASCKRPSISRKFAVAMPSGWVRKVTGGTPPLGPWTTPPPATRTKPAGTHRLDSFTPCRLCPSRPIVGGAGSPPLPGSLVYSPSTHWSTQGPGSGHVPRHQQSWGFWEAHGSDHYAGPHGCSSTFIVTISSPKPILGAKKGFRKNSIFQKKFRCHSIAYPTQKRPSPH